MGLYEVSYDLRCNGDSYECEKIGWRQLISRMVRVKGLGARRMIPEKGDAHPDHLLYEVVDRQFVDKQAGMIEIVYGSAVVTLETPR